MDDSTREEPTRRWAQAFLDSLKSKRCVTTACRAAGIGRTAAYDFKKRSKSFSDAWDEAMQAHVDDLEASAMERATHGWLEDGVRKYSATLTIFMLKAHLAKYRFDRSEQPDDSAAEVARALADLWREMDDATRVQPPQPPQPSPPGDGPHPTKGAS